MAIADRLLKKFNLYVEAQSFLGQAEEIQLPKLAIKTEDFLAAGMDAPVSVDLGMEKLETTITLTGYNPDILSVFGWSEASGLIKLEAKGALESADGTVEAVSVVMHGKIITLETDPWKPGATSKVKFTMNLRYYRLRVGARVVHEIDLLNMRRVIDGGDQLAEIRAAIA